MIVDSFYMISASVKKELTSISKTTFMIKNKSSIPRFLGEPKPLKNKIKTREVRKVKQRINENKEAGDDEMLTEPLKYPLEALLKELGNNLNTAIDEYNIDFGLSVLKLMQKFGSLKILDQKIC